MIRVIIVSTLANAGLGIYNLYNGNIVGFFNIGVVIFCILSAIIIDGNLKETKMSKPIIRHCRNCQRCKHITDFMGVSKDYCTVKYKDIPVEEQRLEAIFCAYYRKKEVEKNDL